MQPSNGHTFYYCLFCRRELNRARLLFNDQLASIVVIVGAGRNAYGSLTPACERHEGEAIEAGLRALAATRGRAAETVWLFCNRIERDALGAQIIGRAIFNARRRIATPDAEARP